MIGWNRHQAVKLRILEDKHLKSVTLYASCQVGIVIVLIWYDPNAWNYGNLLQLAPAKSNWMGLFPTRHAWPQLKV